MRQTFWGRPVAGDDASPAFACSACKNTGCKGKVLLRWKRRGHQTRWIFPLLAAVAVAAACLRPRFAQARRFTSSPLRGYLDTIHNAGVRRPSLFAQSSPRFSEDRLSSRIPDSRTVPVNSRAWHVYQTTKVCEPVVARPPFENSEVDHKLSAFLFSAGSLCKDPPVRRSFSFPGYRSSLVAFPAASFSPAADSLGFPTSPIFPSSFPSVSPFLSSSLWMIRVVMPIIPTPESLCPPRAPVVYEELLRRANVTEVNYLTSLRSKADEILPLLFDIARDQGREISPGMTFKPQQFEQLKRLHEAHLRGDLEAQLAREKETQSTPEHAEDAGKQPEPTVGSPESWGDVRLARIVSKHSGKQTTRRTLPAMRSSVPAAFHLIDDLYGPIYDKKVLLKQVHYFLEQGNYEAVRKVLRENRNVLCMEDAKKLLEFAASVIEAKEKAALILRIEAAWDSYRQALPPSFTQQDAKNLQFQLAHLSAGAASGTSPPSEVGDKGSPASRQKKREKQIDKRKRREAEAALRTQAHLLKRLYEKATTEIRGLQHEAGLRVRAVYHSIHKALWDHGALKPYKKRPGKNMQRATLDVEDVSPYLKPPPEATRLERLEATEAFARAVDAEDWMEACKILRTKTRLLMFKSRHKLLARFLELYQVVHAKAVKPQSPEGTAAISGKGDGEDSGDLESKPSGHEQNSGSDSKFESDVDESTAESGDKAKRKRLTRREKNALRRTFTKPPLGGPYSEKELTFFRKVWWTTLRKPAVVMKLLEPVAEWGDEEAKNLYRVQLGEYRERKRQRNIQFWRDRGIDLTKYTMDFSDAKGLDWLRQKQAEGALDAPPPTLCKTKKQLEEEKKQEQLEAEQQNREKEGNEVGDETEQPKEDGMSGKDDTQAELPRTEQVQNTEMR
ncbi:putative transmembrane protein [Toxoplasma gondii MAS]|uniref:Putative transmembrane protein n=1 Tax=Toxoplasma gondii MAS TaxID=943118 RepID=A0A086PYN3_TOXGO|nr:putative transmembrane protein [Toxoplasma gondii MAS]